MAVNHLYQPWRAILSMINQCLTCKTSGHDRLRYPVLQLLWGIITSKLGDSDVHTLEDPTLILEILSRRFFLRLNLPDHRSVLTGSGGSNKDGYGARKHRYGKGEWPKGIELVMAYNSHLRSDKPSDLGLNGQLGKSTSFSDVSILVMALHNDESPIFQSVSIHENPSSFVDAAGAAISEPSKPRANFCSLSLENLCVPLVDDLGFTIETVSIEYEWKPPHCDLCKIFCHIQDHCPIKVTVPPKVVTPTIVTPIVENPNDGFQTMGKKKKKGKSESTNGGHFGGHSVKQTVRYEPKETTTLSNITMSNSYAALVDKSDEDVENVYNESTNLLHSIHTGGSSSTFTVAAG
ncbi:hypothetical protein Tco_0773892 [Tanacetum coccineum]|uniref:Zinc knuckle CX2CX4HX4C n=1 Tax=Tanacetum coccineum TaxID=301880 RepID=A0ABQ4ZP84_9ASTR